MSLHQLHDGDLLPFAHGAHALLEQPERVHAGERVLVAIAQYRGQKTTWEASNVADGAGERHVPGLAARGALQALHLLREAVQRCHGASVGHIRTVCRDHWL